VTRLRNVKLAAKFVFRDEPGVYKKVSSNKARCVFGPKEAYNTEVGIDPDSEVFVIDGERPRETRPPTISRIDSSSGNELVKVVFEGEDDVVLCERTLPWNEALSMVRADVVVARLAPRRRKEIMDIGDVGFDMEEKTLYFEVLSKRPVQTKKTEDEGSTEE